MDFFKKCLTWIILSMGLLLAIVLFIVHQNTSGKLDNFAKCLKSKGAIFYGAFWCSHCQNQKAEFGQSEKYLPYVECSTSDGNAQTDECKKKNIKSYPTWEFKDGLRETGEVSLDRLSEKTSCILPK